VTEPRDEADSPRPPGAPQRTDQPGPGLGKVRDTDGAGRTDALDPEATEPVGGAEPTDDPADQDDQEVQP
jgi:hypothetical protein